MKFILFSLLCVVSCQLFVGTARGAIQYGSTTKQAPFAASTTQQVGQLLDKVVPGGSGDDPAAIDTPGLLSRIGSFFVSIDAWLSENASISFFGILKGIGNFFLIVIQFVVELLRKVL